MAYYMHHVPGRIRIKTPTLKGDPVKAAEAEEMLATIQGVRSTTVNPLTGSLTIIYDIDLIDSKAILDRFVDKEIYDPAKAGIDVCTMEDPLIKAGRFISKALVGFVAEKALAGTPFALLSVIL